MNRTEIMRQAIRTYGADAQEKMLLEEMSELQKEICKHWRGRDNTRAIAEEIADVEIMLDQMKMIFGNESLVTIFREQKLLRLRDRITDACVAMAADMA